MVQEAAPLINSPVEITSMPADRATPEPLAPHPENILARAGGGDPIGSDMSSQQSISLCDDDATFTRNLAGGAPERRTLWRPIKQASWESAVSPS